MKKPAAVVAAVNLHAVLRNLEDLCKLDAKARDIIAGKKVSVRFLLPGSDNLVLRFQGEESAAVRNSSSADMDLRFLSPAHFNSMIEGSGAPIPTKGFGHISFLKSEFTKLAELLTKYLRPGKEDLADEGFRTRSTILTAYTAFFALAEIGNMDPVGKVCAGGIEDGSIQIDVPGVVSIVIEAKGGKLSARKGSDPKAKAFMIFDDIETAGGILRGTLDSYECIGKGKLRIKGRIAMIDNLNRLLGLVSRYLG